MERDANFGARFYNAMRSRGLLHMLTHRFNYEKIQELKAADRAATINMLLCFGWGTVQAMKAGSPETIADRFANATMAASSGGVAFMFM